MSFITPINIVCHWHMVFFGNVAVMIHFGGRHRKQLFRLLTVLTSINQRRIFGNLSMNYAELR